MDDTTTDVFFDAMEYADSHATDDNSFDPQATNIAHLSEYNDSAVPLEKPKSASLLDLPAELWIKIGQEAIRPQRCAYHTRYSTPCMETFHDLLAAQPPITRVCKILRAELLPYYYGKFDLCLSRDFDDPFPDSIYFLRDHAGVLFDHMSGQDVARWLGNIGLLNRRAIGSLRVVSTSFLGTPRIEKIVSKLQGEWLVAFNIGEREECILSAWPGSGHPSYRVTFS